MVEYSTAGQRASSANNLLGRNLCEFLKNLHVHERM